MYVWFHRFAEKNNLPKLEYVSLPRAGAMKVIMEEVGPHRDQGASTSKENSKKGNKQLINKTPDILNNQDNDLNNLNWVNQTYHYTKSFQNKNDLKYFNNKSYFCNR